MGIGANDYYLKYNNGFTVGTGSANVYFFEETDLTVFDINVTVSPSGIGTVTGTGRYLKSSNCTLTATPNNSEYAFSNWTQEGVVVSTNNPYSFTVRADQNLVANFESVVSCLTPTNLAVINESIAAHTAALNWIENGEATQWQVVYSTDANFDPDGATPTLVSYNPYTITGLAQSTTYYAYVRAYCEATDQSAWSNQATFSTIAGNQPPTNLTLGTPEAHSFTLSWTGVSTNVNHQNYEVYHSTTNIVPSDDLSSGYEVANTNSYTINGLNPETTYYAWVRDNCGTDGKSAWVAFMPFTTGIACPAPTNVTASNVTNNSAVISWAGEAESYNVQYRIPASEGETLSYDFEDGTQGWTVLKGNTGDSPNNWHHNTTHVSYSSGTAQDWSSFGNNSSSGFMLSESYISATSSSGTAYGAVTPDNYLVSPQVRLGGSISFYAGARNTDYCAEKFSVMVSTTGNTNVDSFTTVETKILSLDAAGYTSSPYTIDLSAYSGMGYIAIRHWDCYDQWVLCVDDITIVEGPTEGTSWQSAGSGLSPFTITRLESQTNYEVQVQANCGSLDGLSQWSASATFQTLDDCTVPSGLNSTDVAYTAATLSWEGIQESYNVQYRNIITAAIDADDTYNFNDGTQGWTTIDADGQGDAWSYQSSGGNSGGCMRAKWNTTYDHQDYLVSPQITLGGFISFYAKKGGSYTDTFRVYLSTSGNTNASDFTIELTDGDVNPSTNYTQYTYDLSNYSGMGYVAIVYTALKDQYYLYIDDINIYAHTPGVYGPWVTESNVTSPLEVTGLMPITTYEWQVQGVDCDGNGSTTDWSETATFSTMPLPTFTKTIEAYEGEGGYYLIASPLAEAVAPTEVGMITEDEGDVLTYDLYFFDQAQEAEWRNYRENNFNLENGKGYLYANKNTVTLTFTGAPGTNGQVTLSKTSDESVDFQGLNLVGNPFGVEAYLPTDRAFYTMQNSDAFTAKTGDAIGVMEGVFVVANEDEETLTFTTTAPSKVSKLNLNLTKDNSYMDRAIVRFDEGSQLPKVQFREGSTKVYIPQDGIDYAVVTSEGHDAMPVNFKAESSGRYTLSFTSEEVSFAYLHLIDNMTGIETDLTQTPSYSFDAKTTDYENRFKLVFATSNDSNDNTFAFFSNGSFVINNEGEATLQVIDVNGRILKSESINGCANINVNAAQGVYMLRLVNSDNVKVQKVIIK